MRQVSYRKIIAAWFILVAMIIIPLSGYQHLQTTASPIQALLGKRCPAEVLGATGASVYVRIEGQDATIWRGNITVSKSDIKADNSGKSYHLSTPTALGTLDEASNHEQRFPYYVTDAYGALFVSSVDGEKNQGTNGWMYRVNYYSPNAGADQFIVGETTPPEPPHGEVLWYYGAWSDAPLKISLSDTEVDVGDEFTATITQYSDTTHDWSLCEGATVYANHHGYTTDVNGTAAISIASEGTYNVFAEKDSCIRSDKIRVTVTAPAPVTYNLTTTVNGNGSTTPSVGSHTYDAGTRIDVSATPDEGWQFDNWSGDVANPSSSSTTVTMDADRAAIANFVEIPSVIYTLTVTCKPGGSGSVTPSPTAKDNQYEAGTSIELTATPIKDYAFDSWSGDLSGSTNPVSITMDCAKNVTANFVLPALEKPAHFLASPLNISPQEIQPNQQVNISISITNDGGETGSYEAVLYINGQMENSQTVSISSGSTQNVAFSVTRATPGTYTISLGGQQEQFTVMGNQVSNKGLDTGSTIAIIVIIVLIAALVLVFRRIKRGA